MTIPASAHPLLLTGNDVGGYQIERSIRLNQGDTSHLTQSTTRSVTANTSITISFWLKLASLSTDQEIFHSSTGSYFGIIYFGSYANGALWVYDGSGNDVNAAKSDGLLRDPSAWYHIVYSRAHGGRGTLYINGIAQLTQTANNSTSDVFSTARYIGKNTSGRSCSCYLADFTCIDGLALTPASFGANDSNGAWQPQKYTGSYGEKGFRLSFANPSTLATLSADASGNQNHWTANNIQINNLYTADFDGSNSDYIRKSGSGVLTSNSDVTIECHIYPRTTSVIGIFDGGIGQTAIIRNYGVNKIAKQAQESTGATFSVTANQWQHFACTFSGGQISVYVNGSLSGSGTYTGGYSGGSTFDIGTINGGSDGKFDGYIRNFRVTNSLVYTSSFNAPSYFDVPSVLPSTTLLTLVSSLSDLSSNAFALTNNGAALSKNNDLDTHLDSPTIGVQTESGAGGEVSSNYCVLNPIDQLGSNSFSNGNLDVLTDTGTLTSICATFAVRSGKWYWEVLADSSAGMIGVADYSQPLENRRWNAASAWFYYGNSGQKYFNSGGSPYGTSYSAGDIIGVALDMDSGAVAFYLNGVAQGIAFNSGLSGKLIGPCLGNGTSGSGRNYRCNFGQRAFEFGAAPQGYKTLCTANLPQPLIAHGQQAMGAKLYTGNSSTQVISGFKFSPDLVWIKSRSNASYSHILYDTIRGAGKRLFSNLTNAEDTQAQSLTSFDSAGFSLGSLVTTNGSGDSYIAWGWDAGTAAVANSQGSLASTVRVNPSAGFSIVSYNHASGVGASTVGHGLGAAPHLILSKYRDGTTNWDVYVRALGPTGRLMLNSTSAFTTESEPWNNTNPTSTVFSVGPSSWKGVGNHIAYCFAPVSDYSAFGSYIGSSAGPFVYTGFRPQWILIKVSSSNIDHWIIFDSQRSGSNVADDLLWPNLPNAEISNFGSGLDITSNGFRVRGTWSGTNNNGSTYIYAAFAEHPFKYARAR